MKQIFLLSLYTLLFFAHCSSSNPPPPASITAAAFPGDQNATITAANTVVNRYSAIKQDLTHGKTELAVGVDVLQPLLPLQRGDLLLVIQMQGAQMISPIPNTNQYGEVSNQKGAGLFEWVRVFFVDEQAGTITLDPQSGGLINDYSAAGKTQIVWVAQYKNLSVTASGSITAQPWDGQKGGIVAIQAQDIELLGKMDVSGQGFKGGGANTSNPNVSTNVIDYVSVNPLQGGEKGESVIGSVTDYDTLGGRYGRGAPGNGGGGGNAFKAGGGGGANQIPPLLTWSGQGIMNMAIPSWVTAWGLDPQAGNPPSAGGGRGGYTSSTMAQIPTTVGPGPTGMGADVLMWGGNYRRERGGLGGRPFVSDPSNRITFGGGGGSAAPSPSQNTGSRGGNGGGIVYLISKNVHGSGQILANGAAGENSPTTDPNQGGGGGGGGGSIFIRSPLLGGGLTLWAQGGKGGDHLGNTGEADGPGGGGGGGFVALTVAGSITTHAEGGAGGISQSTSMNLFQANGATDGASGNNTATFSSVADIQTVISTNTAGLPSPGRTAIYTLKVYNQGPDYAQNVSVNGTFSPVYPDAPISWTCQSDNPSLALCHQTSGTGPVNPQVDLAPGTYVNITITVPIPDYLTQKTDPFLFQGSASYANDVDPGNNNFNYELSPPADVAISLSPDPVGFQNQNPIVYTIPVENLGPYCAHDLDLEMILSPGLTPQGAEGDGFICSYIGQTIHCKRPEMSVGDKSTIRIQVLPLSTISSFEVKVKLNTQSFDPDGINNLGTHQESADGLRATLAGKGIGCSIASSSVALSSPWFFELLVGLGFLKLRRFVKRTPSSQEIK